MGLAGLKRAKRLAKAAGRLLAEALLVAVATLGLAELLPEGAIGKGHMVVGAEQADHGGQRLKHVIQALALTLHASCKLALKRAALPFDKQCLALGFFAPRSSMLRK